MEPELVHIGVGATRVLNLRLSVATLARVQFSHPQSGETMLVLERTATLREMDGQQDVIVRAKPFGGAVRLNHPGVLKTHVGDFNFDSQRSCDELDFRIYIREEDRERVQQFCLKHLHEDNGVLESQPERELFEEFEGALQVRIRSDQYVTRTISTLIEDHPADTQNVRARGSPTVRIYKVFEVHILDPTLIAVLLRNSARYSNEDLRELAWADALDGGRGRANAVLVLPLELLRREYDVMPYHVRAELTRVQGHDIESNVLAILDGIKTTKYRRF